MNRIGAVIGGACLLLLVMGFAALNGGERVTLRLGFMTVRGLPLTAVAFGSLILGMLVMFLAGVRADLRVRRILRERFENPEDRDPPAPPDLTQRELFIDEPG